MPKDMSHAMFVTLELRIPITSKRGIIKLPRFDFYLKPKMSRCLGSGKGASSGIVKISAVEKSPKYDSNK